jgi:Flp pilus assembly protein CpaB
MRRISVLAVMDLGDSDPDGPGEPEVVVTLLVSPEQAEVLAMAQLLGEIRLLLR